MKRTFTFTTALLITLLISLNVLAQQNNGNQGNVDVDTQELARRQTELMERTLHLTAEQLKLIYDLHLDYADQLKDIHEAMAEDKTNGRGQLVSLSNKKDVDLKKILTVEQWAAWEEWRTATKEDGSTRKGI